MQLANLDLRPLFLGVQARFWQQANLYVFIWAACGVHYLTSLFFFDADKGEPTSSAVPSTSDADDTKRRSASWLLRSGRLVLLLVCVTYAVCQVVLHYPRMDHHDSTGFIQSGRAILDSFPTNSIVLLNGDLNNNIIKYPQQSAHTTAHPLQCMAPTRPANSVTAADPSLRYRHVG